MNLNKGGVGGEVESSSVEYRRRRVRENLNKTRRLVLVLREWNNMLASGALCI
jgi:hypothetical protein